MQSHPNFEETGAVLEAHGLCGSAPCSKASSPRMESVIPGESGGCSTRLSCGRDSSRRPGYPAVGAAGQIWESRASALALWADRSGVSLEVIDAYPSAASAIRAAEASRPTWCLGPTVRGPRRGGGRQQGVVWNHGGATARLARPAFAGRQRGVSRLPLSRRSARNPCRRRSW